MELNKRQRCTTNRTKSMPSLDEKKWSICLVQREFILLDEPIPGETSD